MTMQQVSEVVRAAVLVREQYVEMPGLSLTVAQGARLVGLDRALTGEALRRLECDGFLVRTWSGRFVRRDSAPVQVRPADAVMGTGVGSGLQPA
jgi:hypothetical protein